MPYSVTVQCCHFKIKIGWESSIAYTFKIDDAEKAVRIESEVVLLSSDARLTAALVAIQLMHDAIPCTLVELKLDTDMPYPTFNYKIDLSDERRWRQKIIFIGGLGQEPYLTFDVSDPWRLSEFSLQRAVRDAFVLLCKDLQITLFRVSWS